MTAFSKRIQAELKEKQRTISTKLQQAHSRWLAQTDTAEGRHGVEQAIKDIAADILKFMCHDYAGQNADGAVRMLSDWQDGKEKIS